MRRLLPMGLTAVVLTAPAAQAATITFVTGQTNAQTQIDVNHSTIINFSLAALDPSLTVVGNFELKRGPQTVDPIVFKLFNGPNATGGILDTDSKLPGDITQAFTAGYIFTLGPLALGPGSFSVALTSVAPDQQAEAYFIKGIEDFEVTCEPNCQPPPTEVIPAVPEPASLSLLGLGLLAGARRFRRR